MIASRRLWLCRLRDGSRLVAAVVWLTLVGMPHVDAVTHVDDAAIKQQRAQHLAFEPNRGQTAEEVRFIGRGSDYTVFLTATEAVFAPRLRADWTTLRAHAGASEIQKLRMLLLDANPSPTVVA